VGCCDSSPNRHATAHFHATERPIVQSFEPGEDWRWCFVDEVLVQLGESHLEPNGAGVLPRVQRGGEGRVGLVMPSIFLILCWSLKMRRCVDIATIVIISVAVAIGAVIQGSIGFGYALVAVPALVLLLPWAVPVTPLLLALPLTTLMSAREWRSIDFDGFLLITLGRLLGTTAGVALLVLVPRGSLSTLTGLLIVAAALASFFKPSFQVRNSTRLTGGVASGVVGTVAALGGTPLALVYQDRSGAELRSTLSVSFVVGIAMSLVGLGLAGKVEVRHFVLALELLPGLLVGLWASRWVVKRLNERWLRPAVLTFAAVAGVAIILVGLGD
jgi:uncharacterized membrane protein YfcA